MPTVQTQKKVRILSLDGGGIRGIIPALVLEYVEQQLQEKTQNTNARIADYFDMIVGTSTGGILACYYLIPNDEPGPSSKYNATRALEIYANRGKEIFNQAKQKSWFGLRQLFNATKFSPKNLEHIFMETFGDLKYHELLKPCLVTSFNMSTGKAVFFNSSEPKAKQEKRKFYVRDVTRSTSAAPTYFPPAIIKNLATNEEMVNLDGGVFANNPSMCAYAEARKTNFEQLGLHKPMAKDLLILSIGTGSMPSDIENYRKSKRWSIINWAKTIPDIMMDGGLDTVNYQIDKIFKSLGEEHQKNYKRINVPQHMRFPEEENRKFKPPYNSDMSDASDRNVAALKKAGKKALQEANTPKEGEQTLDEFIDELIAIQKVLNPVV